MSAVFQAIPIQLFIYCIFHLSGDQCNHQQELKLVGCRSTVEPRNNPRDWQNLFTIRRFRYIDVLFHIFYYYWVKKKQKKTCLFYRGLRYEEVCYIFLMATEPLNFFCTIEPKKYSRPRIKFLGASDDEDSEKEEQLEQDKRSAVKPAEKSKRKPVFADEVFSRPKVSAHLYKRHFTWRYNFFLCCVHSWDRENQSITFFFSKCI